jgi:hypothetical protein
MRKDFSARKQEIASNKWDQSSKIEPKGLVAGPLRNGRQVRIYSPGDFGSLRMASPSLLQGWNLLSSGNGYEGITRFAQEVADAVVVDLNNGGAESALIMGELQRLRPEIPVIF